MINNELQQFLMRQDIELFSIDTTNHFITVLPQFGYLKITGDKAITFLQGQLTCDLLQLTPTQSLWGAYLNLKGRVITTLRVFYWQDHIYLQLPTDLLSIVQNKLAKIALLSRVTLTDVSDQFATLGLSGKTIFDLPTSLYGSVSDKELTIIKTGASEQTMLIGSPQAVIAVGTQTALPWGERLFWDYLQIQQKMVEVDKQITELFTPHDIALAEHQAVSFTKGCYVGQEIVARMEYRGKLKQQLYRVTFHSAPPLGAGMNLYNSEANIVGQIARVCMVPDQSQIALIVAKNEMVGQKLYSDGRMDLECSWVNYLSTL